MSTKTITITDPKDFQAGDTYYGTFVRTDRPGIKTVVDGGTLSRGVTGRLYVLGLGSLPYVDVVADNGRSNGHWTDFHTTREVEVKEHLRFQPGSVVTGPTNNTYVLGADGGWVGFYVSDGKIHRGTKFHPQESAILSTIESARVFRESYRLLSGPQPEEVD